MKLYKKIIVNTVVFSMVISCFSQGTVYAAPPSPKCDESMYVNLDYYGVHEETRVVKSYSVNGCNEIVDFGNYQKITNMTNFVKPQVNNGKVVFKLDKDVPRFYFEAVPTNQKTSLPWTFDVSYKLNGVDKKAEELAGASGLVEIKIKTIPNSKIGNYYKNNMLLQVGTVIDMDDNLSVEAPGAQLQTVGNKKAVIFMGLPGEENEFIVRIGSDDFEFPGFGILMIPATLDQLTDLKDLKETKEKIEDSRKAIDSSLDVVLDTLESMQSSLDTTSKGLKDLDSARDTVSTSKGKVYEKADKTLENLSDTAKQLEKFLPHLEAQEQFIIDVNKQVNVIVDSTKEVKYKLGKLQKVLDDLNSNMKELQNMVDDMSEIKHRSTSSPQKRISKSDDIKLSIAENIETYNELSKGVSKDIDAIKNASKSLDSSLEKSDISSDSIMKLSMAVKGSSPTLEDIAQGVGQIGQGLGKLGTELQNVGTTASGLKSTADQYSSDMKSTMGNTKALNETISEIAELSKKVIDGIVGLNEVLNDNEPIAVQAVRDAKDMLELSIESVNNAHDFLKESENMLKKSGTKLDEGTKKSIEGLIDALQKSITGLGETSKLRNAKNEIRDLIDQEWDKYTEDENHMLNIDTEAPKVSFTSSQNKSPESIQIILRTKEITKDDIEKQEKDLEKEAQKDNGSVISRIANIFKQIFVAVKSVFE